jgi:Fuc2NAc and GlcNAc transferase
LSLHWAWWLGGVFFCACLLTGALRRYALSRGVVDVPNDRSSHTSPTPRGGGLAIALPFLAILVVGALTGDFAPAGAVALVGAGVGVAWLGFLDDHGHIPARWRLAGHFIAASWVLFWIGGLPTLRVFGVALDPGWPGHAVAAVYLVWLLNLYNFMDGIDGIAGIEAVCVGLGGALLCGLAGQGELAFAAALLAVAAAGFLVWNFPPAKIFMGDAGSGFLGIVLGALSVMSAHGEGALLWAWMILLGVFIVDATVTLIRRVLRGETFYEAHRSHAYQHAARELGAHRPVSLMVGAINLLWLLPIALLVGTGWLDGALGAVVAYLPLAGLALRYRAGVPDQ